MNAPAAPPEMKRAGATTIAQDEATSVAFRTPRVAIEPGAVDRVPPLPEIPRQLLGAARERAVA